MSKKKKLKLDEFHYHEALDRTHVVTMIIEDNLVNHPVFEKHKKLQKKIKKAQSILCDVYQAVGSTSFLKFHESDNK
jgi:hypothetical protein